VLSRGGVLVGVGQDPVGRAGFGTAELTVCRGGVLVEVPTPELDLRRSLRVIWADAASPPAGAARDLIAHIRNWRVPGGPQVRPTGPSASMRLRTRSRAGL